MDDINSLREAILDSFEVLHSLRDQEDYQLHCACEAQRIIDLAREHFEKNWKPIDTVPKTMVRFDLWVVWRDDHLMDGRRLIDCIYRDGQWLDDVDDPVEVNGFVVTHWRRPVFPPHEG